jgi:hypothetical protein
MYQRCQLIYKFVGHLISLVIRLLDKLHVYAIYLFVQQMVVNFLLCAGNFSGNKNKSMTNAYLFLKAGREDRLCDECCWGYRQQVFLAKR